MSDLYRELRNIANAFIVHRENIQDTYNLGEDGTVGVDGPYNDDDGEYIRVGFNLPIGVYAEIDGDTYGSLQAFRIYREK